MAQIQPVTFPITGEATTLQVTVLNFTTDATTCTTYYQLLTDGGSQCLQGNYTMTPEEFADWGQDNSYVDIVVAAHLGLTII